MIAGETEQLVQREFLEADYDDFFGSKKKRRARRAKRKARRVAKKIKRRSEPKRIERKEKRSRFFKDIGQIYRDVGGATAIGATIDSITAAKPIQGYDPSLSEQPTDYSIDIGSPEALEKEKKSIPTVVYVLGGVVVIGVLGLLVMNTKKNKQYQHYS